MTANHTPRANHKPRLGGRIRGQANFAIGAYFGTLANFDPSMNDRKRADFDAWPQPYGLINQRRRVNFGFVRGNLHECQLMGIKIFKPTLLAKGPPCLDATQS